MNALNYLSTRILPQLPFRPATLQFFKPATYFGRPVQRAPVYSGLPVKVQRTTAGMILGQQTQYVQRSTTVTQRQLAMIQQLHKIDTGLSSAEIKALDIFIESRISDWEKMEVGPVLRFTKQAHRIPRTIEVFKADDGELNIMIKCKSYVCAQFPGEVVPFLRKYTDRFVGKGAYKAVTNALNWKKQRLEAGVVMRPSDENELRQLRKTFKIANQFAGKRGFPDSSMGYHEYKSKSGVLKLAYYMPLYPEGNLWNYAEYELRRKINMPLDRENRIEYLRDIVYGLGYLKQANVCNMDIKPDNYLIGRDKGKFPLKLVDFDFAFKPNEDEQARNFLVATFAFESPDRIYTLCTASREKISPFTKDVWSAGLSYLVMLGSMNQFLMGKIVNFLGEREKDLKNPLERLKAYSTAKEYYAVVDKHLDELFKDIKLEYGAEAADIDIDLTREMLRANPEESYTVEQLMGPLGVVL